MRYLSVCSGIEAASVATKACAVCGAEKPLDDFHRQPKGPQGRHSYCKACYNARYRNRRRREHAPAVKREYNLRARYGLTADEAARMFAAQGRVCAICRTATDRPVIDHDHATGAVRGILCHGCNIKLPAVEDEGYRTAALRYLGAE